MRRTSLRKNISAARLAHQNAKIQCDKVVDRVADTITKWGTECGYFIDQDEAESFCNELKFILITQTRRVQLTCVVQHRRQRCTATSQCMFHLGC